MDFDAHVLYAYEMHVVLTTLYDILYWHIWTPCFCDVYVNRRILRCSFTNVVIGAIHIDVWVGLSGPFRVST